MIAACLAPALSAAQAVPDHTPFGELDVALDTLEFARTDIVSVSTYEADGQPVIAIGLSPHLDSAFTKMMEGRVGYEVTMRVCGKKVFAAQLESELKRTSFVVEMRDTNETEAAAQLLRDPPCENA